MPAAYFEMLMRHHSWAVARLLEPAAQLSDDQLRGSPLSHGPILATLRHVADVDQSWSRVAQGMEVFYEAELGRRCPDLTSLKEFCLAECQQLADFASSLTADELERELQPPWRQGPSKVWQILIHIAVHGAEHANELGWQMHDLGHSTGELGFMEFLDLDDRTTKTFAPAE